MDGMNAICINLYLCVLIMPQYRPNGTIFYSFYYYSTKSNQLWNSINIQQPQNWFIWKTLEASPFWIFHLLVFSFSDSETNKYRPKVYNAHALTKSFVSIIDVIGGFHSGKKSLYIVHCTIWCRVTIFGTGNQIGKIKCIF